MQAEGPVSWQSIRDTIMLRIRSRVYAPGAFIPNEADIAAEFGCARATINRALRDLAASGFLDRRRKAGTRVLPEPRRKATLTIPLIRDEIERRGQSYGYRLITRRICAPPAELAVRLGLSPAARVLHVQSLHLADGVPHMFEDRWIVLDTVPEIADVDLAAVSPNEWLVRQMPYTHGTMRFLAALAGEAALHLNCTPSAPILVMERATWMQDQPITVAVQSFAPSYGVNLDL